MLRLIGMSVTAVVLLLQAANAQTQLPPSPKIFVDKEYLAALREHVYLDGAALVDKGLVVRKTMRFNTSPSVPCGSVEAQVPVGNEIHWDMINQPLTFISVCKLPFVHRGRLLEITGGELSVTLHTSGEITVGTVPYIMDGRYQTHTKPKALQKVLSMAIKDIVESHKIAKK